MNIQSYADLKAWQEAILLATEVYRHTREYPLAEIAGLTAETRRAAATVAGQIAEGWARRSSTREFRAAITSARGALMQLETYLILGHRLEYLSREAMDSIWPLTQTAAEEIRVLMRAI